LFKFLKVLSFYFKQKTAYDIDREVSFMSLTTHKEEMIVVEPPRVGNAFGVLVPQSDADGNDLGGVRLPELQVPLATYTGWNLRDPAIGAPEQRVSFLGSWIPLAKTAEERKKSGDPRLSIAERYV